MKCLICKMTQIVNLTSSFRLLYCHRWGFKSHCIKNKSTLSDKNVPSFYISEQLNFQAAFILSIVTEWLEAQTAGIGHITSWLLSLDSQHTVICLWNTEQLFNTRGKGDVYVELHENSSVILKICEDQAFIIESGSLFFCGIAVWF